MRFLIAFICFSNLFLGCTANSSYYEDVSDPELFLEAVQNLSDIIVYDIFSPPVASRVYYPVDSKEKLSSQLDLLIKKKYTTANEFAGESITDIFGKKILSQASEEIVEELQSGYYKNHDGKFTFIPFDIALQWGPITYIEKLEEASTSNLIMGGSKIDLPPYQGLWNSQESYFFTSIHEFSKLSNEGISTYHQKVGNLKPLIWNDQPYFIIIPHNNPIQIFKINHEAN